MSTPSQQPPISTDPLHDLSQLSLPFPAPTRTTTATLPSTTPPTPTTILLTSFTDKLVLTISQHGKLGQWLSVPLGADDPTSSDPHFNLLRNVGGDGDGESNEALLPVTRFQPRVLLGAGGGRRETVGLLLASQVASLICARDPAEGRVLLLGLGLGSAELGREGFLEVLDLVTKVL